MNHLKTLMTAIILGAAEFLAVDSAEASDQVRLSSYIDYKACKGHPDDISSICSGMWSKLIPIEIELIELDNGPELSLVSQGVKFFNPIINGIQFRASIRVEKWVREGKVNYYLEAKVGTDLSSEGITSVNLYLDSLDKLNGINIIGGWVNEGDRYAMPILRIGPPHSELR